MKFNSGDRVQWLERNGSVTCTGTIAYEDRHQDGSNPLGFYTIRVDMEPISNYHYACHTASEMHHQTVSRSTLLNQLQLQSS